MAKDKKSFILYTDQKELFCGLEDDEAGRLIKHIMKYVNDENPEPQDKITKIAFEPIKQQLKRDLRSWESEIERKAKRERKEWRQGGVTNRNKP